ARVRTPRMTESVASDSTGSRLFVAAPADGKTCCTIYALAPDSLKMTPLVSPALSVTVADGRILAQRGNNGIEVFDAETLAPLPKIPATAIYHLHPSPDGTRVFGLASGPEPMVDLFDAPNSEKIVSHVLQPDARMAGTWMGNEFYIFLTESGT